MSVIKDIVQTTLERIQECLDTDTFQDWERETIELKDLSSGNEWTSLKETICAFLNTNGGYVICGVRERDKKYSVKGFDKANEARLIDLQTKFFKNDKGVLIDLSENISLRYEELSGTLVAVIIVNELSADLKYVTIDNVAYERVLTADKKVPDAKIVQHKEYKTELEYSKEITVQRGATIDDIDVDKVNQFIIKTNTSGKKETVKKDVSDAIDFLERRYCINAEGNVTVLGLLLFGKEPFVHLEYRAEIDCYFQTDNEIGKDKKFYQDDVLNLMDNAFAFVWGHIKVGRSASGGGRSEPEYPERLIREVINNALAHRDYTINKFITIKVNPGANLEITNPGTFKEKMLLLNSSANVRRIIPGIPETKNPKLANVLKVYDKMESQGIGMATLVKECLDNNIDVPYYDLSNPDNIRLVIPSGQLVDDETGFWLSSYTNFIERKLNKQLTEKHAAVIAYFLKSMRLNKQGYYTILFSRSNNHFNVLSDLLSANLINEDVHTSKEYRPVYVLNEELMLSDFTEKIEVLIGEQLLTFDETARVILNIIYRYNTYNNQSVKPNRITPEVYYNIYGKNIEPKKYESLGRKVRKICSELEKRGILSKNNADKSYKLVHGKTKGLF